jgi:hypothetical protein
MDRYPFQRFDSTKARTWLKWIRKVIMPPLDAVAIEERESSRAIG